MAQLAQWSLAKPEIRESNPYMGEKTKIKEIEAGIGPFFNYRSVAKAKKW